jgi:signal transduction histidine kinase
MLVAPSATADELEQRFSGAGASLRQGLAEELLSQLAAMGLVRPARGGDAPSYVTTSLAARSIDAAVGGDSTLLLQELERLRTDLLSTIAHELRTPLTVVRTNIGLLLEPSAQPSDEQRHALLESIERNGDRMQRLVGDLLELSRFRAGTVALQLRSFRAIALAESAIADLTAAAGDERPQIRLTARAHADHRVYGDRRRLEQALLNLLSNAQRFSPPDAEVEVIVERRARQTCWTVIDHGPGISAEDQARLFERFFVGRRDRAGAREGVGLGLPTALAIAQAHGGTIEVDSAVGQGSRFTLAVPTTGPGDEP